MAAGFDIALGGRRGRAGRHAAADITMASKLDIAAIAAMKLMHSAFFICLSAYECRITIRRRDVRRSTLD